MGISNFTLVLSILNFTGSVSSAIGSGFIILCYMILPLRRHFRHVLILNLAVADFINATDLAASGSLILIRRRNLTHSPACVLNGFLGQISVQATDTTILAITLVTVYTITRTSHSRTIQTEWSARTIFFMCIAIWTLPAITSFLALGKGWYGPVSGNWCWLVDDPPYLRYVLTHGWRYLFMLIEIALSIYLHIYLRRHFRTLRVPIISTTAPHPSQSGLPPITFAAKASINTKEDIVIDITKDSQLSSGISGVVDSIDSSPENERSQTREHDQIQPSSTFTSPPTISNMKQNPRYMAIQRILLLNAYPLFYIILWIPGLANRVVEASGHTSRVTQIMQASTQFVGLANAITYGWNERIARELRRKYLGRSYRP